MLVRGARPEDVDEILALWKEMMEFHAGYDGYFRTNEGADEKFRSYLSANMADSGKLVLVCEDGGRVIGYIMAFAMSYPPVYLHKEYVEISDISVSEKHRRKGAGKLLMESALEWIKTKGIARVECRVAVANPVSTAFWEKMGFRPYMRNCVREIPSSGQGA